MRSRRSLCVCLLLLAALFASKLAAQGKHERKSEVLASIAGQLQDGLYHNSPLGFSYKLPFGWVDRTKEMQDAPDNLQPGNSATPASSESGKSVVLLAAFERPPQTTGETVNSAVVITAESISAYPGLKSAADYFGPITEIAIDKGFKAAGGPYELTLDATKLVRGDFNKELGKLTVYQSSLVMLEKGYVVSFSFIAGSEDEIDTLIEGLRFANVTSPAARK